MCVHPHICAAPCTYTCTLIHEHPTLVLTHLYPHKFTCTPKYAYACMRALNDVQGIDTGVRAREKAGLGKGLVVLGSKSGLAGKPAYSFWPEFCMYVVKSTVYCRVLHLCHVRLRGQGQGAACILYYNKLQRWPKRLWWCQSQLWQAFLSNYTCKGWIVVFVHWFFFFLKQR